MKIIKNILIGGLFPLMGLCGMTQCRTPHVTKQVSSLQETHKDNSNQTDTLILFVDAKTVQACGVAPQTCLRIRYQKQDPWQIMYSPISGFKHEEGFEYQIKVKRSVRKQIPQDASRYLYELIEILSKEKRSPDNL